MHATVRILNAQKIAGNTDLGKNMQTILSKIHIIFKRWDKFFSSFYYHSCIYVTIYFREYPPVYLVISYSVKY